MLGRIFLLVFWLSLGAALGFFISPNSQHHFEYISLGMLVALSCAHLISSWQAEKFLNYFESNGWLVGGRTPMKNWTAAANNWILNSKQFALTKTNTASNQQHPAGKLHTETNKNYDEPL